MVVENLSIFTAFQKKKKYRCKINKYSFLRSKFKIYYSIAVFTDISNNIKYNMKGMCIKEPKYDDVNSHILSKRFYLHQSLDFLFKHLYILIL